MEEFKKTQKYRDNLQFVINEVSRGQHLRFIAPFYRTHEVCVLAVRNSPQYDIYSVPEELRDDVIAEIATKHPYVYNSYDFPKEFKLK